MSESSNTSRASGARSSDPSQTEEAIRAFHYVQLISTQVVSKTASELGIAPADLRVLYFLNAEPNATPKQVASHMALTTGAVTSLVDRIVDGGFALRVPNPDDRRSVLLALTPAGTDAVARMTQLYSSAFLESIDPDDMKSVTASLTALGQSFGGLQRGQRGTD